MLEGGPLVNDPLKCVGHDGDQHVENGDLRDEGRQDECHIAERRALMIDEALQVELTQKQQNLVQQRISQRILEHWVDDVKLLTVERVELEHVDGDAEEVEHDEEDEGEVADVDNGANYERHVERGVIKQAQPVDEQLDALADDDEEADRALEGHAQVGVADHVGDDDEKGASVLYEVDVVVGRFKVALDVVDRFSHLLEDLVPDGHDQHGFDDELEDLWVTFRQSSVLVKRVDEIDVADD